VYTIAQCVRQRQNNRSGDAAFPSSEENVLNGIAYDKASGNFYLTGKRWRTILVGKFSGAR
jgi:glutamine cyclotransferase